MQEFDAAKGLFHLFFANDDDAFYTESYVRTNQSFYLYHRLIALKYAYVYAFSGEDYQNCMMTSMDNISAEALNDNRGGRLMDNLFGGGKRLGSRASELPDKERLRSGRKSVRLTAEGFGEALNDLIGLMKRKSRVAVILPMNIFQALVRYPSALEELKRICAKNYQDNNRHIFIITSSCYAGESIRFFKPSGDFLAEDNLFTDDTLFPELVPYFHDLYENAMNFYIYDNVRRFMGDKAVFYHSLSFDRIRRMMTRYALHTDYEEGMSPGDILAMTAVIYAYYHSPEYRRHAHLSLPENPKRSLSAVEESLCNSRSLREQMKQAKMEFFGKADPYQYICRVYADCVDVENGIFMIGGSTYQDELGMLRAIKKIYVNRFGESHAQLDRTIDLLSKPCVDAAVSFSAVSFRQKVIELTHKNIVNELTEFVDTELITAMVRALDYYFEYFRTASTLRGEAVTAKDISFDFYKTIMAMEEKQSRMRKSAYELRQKLSRQELNQETASAEHTRRTLQQIEESSRTIEAVLENAYQMVSVPLSETNAINMMTKMKYETRRLKQTADEQEQNQPAEQKKHTLSY